MIRNSINQVIQYTSDSKNQSGDKSEVQFNTGRKSALVRLLSYSLKYKKLIFGANLSLMIGSLSLVALPYISGKIVDSIAKHAQIEDLNNYTVVFIVVVLIGAIFSSIRSYCFNVLGELIVLDIRNDLFSSILSKDTEFFDNNRSGELISRLTSDVTLVQSACGESISVLIRNTAQFLVSLVFLWILSWQLTLVFLGVIPIFCGFALIFIKQYKNMSVEYQQKLALSTQVAQESIQNIKVVKAFSMEQEEEFQFKFSTQNAYKVGVKKSILIGTFTGGAQLIGSLSMMCILWYGGILVFDGDLTVGNLSSFILYTMTLTFSVLIMSGMFNVLITAAAVSEKIFQIIDEKVTIIDGSYVPENNDQITGEIEINNVKFMYPSKPNVAVLNELSLSIKPGNVIAFVGHSGSGKSTIINILQRFYDPAQGAVLFDKIDLKNYKLKFLHRQIGFVPQEPTLFSGTLWENITYGKRDASMEEVLQVMKQAHVHEFVNNTDYFPEGLQTIVGERGIKLSGGQKQRIAIARALIKNPKILIFDEATSALDAESEYQVQQAIEELMKQGSKTIIIIAHRLSTIMNCETIAVIDKGKICEIGSHNELLRLNGFYKALIERQLSTIDRL